MTPPIRPERPERPSLELTLAQQANDAMQQGADPHATTAMLGTMLKHLRANPAIAQHGSDALAQGADPHAVAGKVWELANAPVEPAPVAPERPGLLSRAGSMLGRGLSGLVHDPAGSVENLIVAPVKSALTAAVAPGIGEARPDARLSKGGNSSGRPIDTSAYDAEHGGVTSRERTAAGVQTLANIASPAAFGSIAKKLGKTAALSVTGAAESAAYNPDDPAAGAMAGAVAAPVVGNAISGTAKLANTTGRVTSLTKRIASATPIDEHALAQAKATEVATRANYGQAAAEAEAVGGTSSALKDALDHPTIKPYVEMVRESSRFKNADDATVAREAYKQISRQRRGLIKRANGPNGYDAKADLEAGDLADAAQVLKGATAQTGTAPRAPTTSEALADFQTQAGEGAGRRVGNDALRAPAADAMAREAAETPLQRAARVALEQRTARTELPLISQAPSRSVATPAVMPSFPTAVSEHARMMGNRAAFNDAVDMTRRTMQGKAVAANRLDTWSPAAWKDRISQMTPEQAAFARDATLGSAKPLIKPVLPSPTTVAAGTAGGAIFGGGPGAAIGALGGFGTGAAHTLTKNMARINRIAPIIDALDAATGSPAAQTLDPRTAMQLTALVQAMSLGPPSRSRNR